MTLWVDHNVLSLSASLYFSVNTFKSIFLTKDQFLTKGNWRIVFLCPLNIISGTLGATERIAFTVVWMCFFHTLDTSQGFEDLVHTSGNRHLLVWYTDMQTVIFSGVGWGEENKKEGGKPWGSYFGWLKLVILMWISP